MDHPPTPALLSLSSSVVRLRLDPDYGARVVSLMDRRSGREWLVQGQASPDTGEATVYGLAHAVGWDECLPTIAPCEAANAPWGRRLRDHGDVWGRRWHVEEISPQTITTSMDCHPLRLRRSIHLCEAVVTVDYQLSNHSDTATPYLWSQHMLLAALPGDRIHLSGVAMGTDLPLSRLDTVAEATLGFAAKFYAPVIGPFEARIGNDNGQLRLAWSGDDMPYVGLWLNYGGWPVTGACGSHVAIEPTTAGADDLNRAIASGHSPPLAARQSRTWRITLTLSTPALHTDEEPWS